MKITKKGNVSVDIKLTFSTESEITSSKEIISYEVIGGGASTKLDTIDDNRDYYAGGADGWSAIEKKVFLYEEIQHKIEFNGLKGAGIYFIEKFIHLLSSQEVDYNENIKFVDNEVNKHIISIKESVHANNYALETGLYVTINPNNGELCHSPHVKVWSEVPLSSYKKFDKKFKMSRSRSYDPYSPKLDLMYLGESQESLQELAGGMEFQLPSILYYIYGEKGDSPKVFINPYLEIQTSIEREESKKQKCPEGWVEVSFSTCPWSKSSGNAVLFLFDEEVRFVNNKNIDAKEHCIVKEYNVEGRGNKEGIRYELYLSPEAHKNMEITYEQDI